MDKARRAALAKAVKLITEAADILRLPSCCIAFGEDSVITGITISSAALTDAFAALPEVYDYEVFDREMPDVPDVPPINLN